LIAIVPLFVPLAAVILIALLEVVKAVLFILIV